MTTDVVSSNPSVSSSATSANRAPTLSASTQILEAFREWRGSGFLMLLTDVIALEACIFLGLLTRIALDCGFADSSYFGRTFRRTMGATPSEYRKKTTDPFA